MFRSFRIFVCIFVNSAWAGIPVLDPTNLAQNTITAVQSLRQAENQIKQMERELEYTTRQLQSLKELGWNDPYALQRHLEFFQSLKNRSDTLTYNYKNLDSNFRRLYSTKDKPIDKRLDDWSQQTETSIQASMKSHGAVDDSKKKMETVSSLIEKQRRAQGDLAAIQVLGELMAIQSRQLEELKTIITLDSRAKQSRMMEDKSIEKARVEQSRHLMKDFNKPMKAKRPMTKFPSLGKGY